MGPAPADRRAAHPRQSRPVSHLDQASAGYVGGRGRTAAAAVPARARADAGGAELALGGRPCTRCRMVMRLALSPNVMPTSLARTWRLPREEELRLLRIGNVQNVEAVFLYVRDKQSIRSDIVSRNLGGQLVEVAMLELTDGLEANCTTRLWCGSRRGICTQRCSLCRTGCGLR